MTPFQRFMSIYPIKRDKARAERAWHRRGLDACLDVVLWALRRDAEVKRAEKLEKGFTPAWKYPQGWINGLDIKAAKYEMQREAQGGLFEQSNELPEAFKLKAHGREFASVDEYREWKRQRK